MRIAFFRSERAGCGHYRIRLPYKALKAAGYDVELFDTYGVVERWNGNKRVHVPVAKIDDPLRVDGQDLIDLGYFDIIVFQLLWDEKLYGFIQILQALGKKVVIDMDDDYTCLPSTNPAYYLQHPKCEVLRDDKNKIVKIIMHNKVVNNRMEILTKALNIADAITVSTPELRDTYRNFNPNVYVCYNKIDLSEYQLIRQRRNKPVIGWAGSTTHIDDLKEITGLPESLRREGYSFKFAIANFKDGLKLFEFADFIPGTDIFNYPKILTNFDIGLVPLRDCKFNSGKSEIKGMEYNALGIPFVASNIAPYRRYVRHGENGFLVKENRLKHWLKYVKLLLDRKIREEMSHKALEIVSGYDVYKNYKQWSDVYYEVLNGNSRSNIRVCTG